MHRATCPRISAREWGAGRVVLGRHEGLGTAMIYSAGAGRKGKETEEKRKDEWTTTVQVDKGVLMQDWVDHGPDFREGEGAMASADRKSVV